MAMPLPPNNCFNGLWRRKARPASPSLAQIVPVARSGGALRSYRIAGAGALTSAGNRAAEWP